MKRRSLPLAAGLVLTGAAALAQYSISWHRVAGGGGTSSGGNYALSGTIGQAEAGGPLTGGSYSLTGGFWSNVTVIQEPGAPELRIVKASAASVRLSWPAGAAGFQLMQNSTLTAGSWTPVTTTPVTVGSENEVTLTVVPPRHYFRLSRP